MPLPKSIPNTAEFSVRCFKPLYVQKEEEYVPWFIGHSEEAGISDEALMKMFEEWKGNGGLENCDDSPASTFANFLEAHGYVIFPSPEAWLWILPVTSEEEHDCIMRSVSADKAPWEN